MGPGSAYVGEFTTSNPTTGSAINADTLPTCFISRNGVDDLSVELTVENKSIGRYKVSGEIPDDYDVGDVIRIFASATVSGITPPAAIIEQFTLSDIDEVLVRILGLLHDNSVLIPTYDAAGNMTSGVVKIYDSSANAIADDGDGLIHTYNIAAPHIGRLFTKWTQTRA